MLKNKKIITVFLAAVAVLALGVTTYAAESPVVSNNTINSPNSGEIQDPDMLKGLTEMKLGETKTVGYLNEVPLKITLVSEKIDDMTRGNKTANKTFNVTYLDKNAITISLKATYFADGIDGLSNYMINLNGSYKIINNTFSASWDNSQNTANETYHGMTLSVHHFTGDADIRFEAWIKPTPAGGVTFYMS